jgi:hypothetical protein
MCNAGYAPAGVVVFDTVDASLAVVWVAEETLIIFCDQLFKGMLPQASHLYLIRIQADIGGKSRLAGYS